MISRICFVFLLALPAGFAEYPNVFAECPNIVGRNQWSKVPPKDLNDLETKPVPYVIIHHTETSECDSLMKCETRVDSIREFHMTALVWNDIGYSFLVGGDGNVYEGRGWEHQGAHTTGYNKNSIGISFIGNFEIKNATQNMLDTAHRLIECGQVLGKIRQNVIVYAARQVTATFSPGKYLYSQIQKWPEWNSTP